MIERSVVGSIREMRRHFWEPAYQRVPARRILGPFTAPERGFTLVELLVVIGVVVLLAVSLLPAFGGAVQKGGRMQCATNLRQIGQASMLYANDFNTWLPIWYDYSGHPRNVIRGLQYTRYVCFLGYPFTKVPQSYTNSFTSAGGEYENLGFLYAGGYSGAGESFFCPAQTGTPLGADSYMPLLRTDSGGVVRSSFAYNPRLIDPGNNDLRRFERTGQLEPSKLFAVDYFDPASGFAHLRERGWNVLMTDGSVRFSTSDQAYGILSSPAFKVDETSSSLHSIGQVLDALELDH